jgi:hypothetical protein
VASSRIDIDPELLEVARHRLTESAVSGSWHQGRGPRSMSAIGPGRVKTLRGITAPGILRLVVTLRAKKCKNSSSAQRYNQIRFRFHTA